jgi:tetratricopeptide (TPR) repeat protein
MPLESVMEIYKEAPLYDSAPDSVLLEHYYSMILSKCYRQSSGRLHCTSCHDPHKQPAGVDAAAYYQARCMSCHNSQGCTLPVNERQKTTPPDNCIACHMTKRPVASITHAALTDHRVTVALGESLPADLVALDKSGHDLIRLTAHPGEEKRTTPDLVLFQVYARLIQDGRAEFRAPMDSLLNRFSHDAPSNSQVLSALARRQLEQGVAVSGELAATYLHKALSLGDADPDDLLLLATLESAANRHAAAIDILKSAIRKNPFSSEFADSLATEYQKTGNYKDCLDVVNRGLKLFPDDQALRALAEKARSAVDSIDHQ